MKTLDVFERFREIVKELPDHVVFQIIDEEGRESFTIQRVADEVAGVSLFLKESGIRPGQRVGIVMENHPRWGIAYLGAQSAGAVVVPFDILHTSDTLAGLIKHAECRLLVGSQKLTSKIQEIQERLPEPLPVLVTGEGPEGWTRWEEVVPREDLEGVPMPLVKRSWDDPLCIMYTSGTTGDPKGVVLTTGNIYRNVVTVLERIKVVPQDHILSVLPLYHALALMANFIIPLYLGARVTYIPVLEAQKILRAFREEGITIFVAVPQFFYLLHKRILHEIKRQGLAKRLFFRVLLRISRFSNDRLGFNPGRLFFAAVHKQFGRQFRLFGVGGARFDPGIARFLRDLGFTIIQAYGMTETAAISTVTPIGSKTVGSVGAPLPHTQIRIDDADENGIGEVRIGGLSVMKEYWKNAGATNETLVDDWIKTGDLGYLDSKGYLYITGRRKDVIVLSSGKNIFPEEVEQHYQSEIPFIKEMCVVGLADDSSSEGQERLHAVVVPDFEELKRRQVVNAAEMIRYTMENASHGLPSYKRVRTFDVSRDPLPRTTTRKIKRYEVLEMVRSERAKPDEPGLEEAAQEPSSEVEERIFSLLRDAKNISYLNSQMSLELDIGLDSLERVEFLSSVQEAMNVRISDEAATEIYTVAELVKAVEERLSGEVTDRGGRRSWKEILEEPLSQEDIAQSREFLKPRPFSEAFVYLVTRKIRLVAWLLLRFRVKGEQNLPTEYPFLICPNHLSYLDAPLVAAAMPYRVVKRVFYLGYAHYFRTGPLRLVGWLTKTVPVNPDRHLRQALRIGAEGLRKNLLLVVFPEGERSSTGKIKSFRKGPAILASALQLPVVPVAISGTYQVWPRGSNRIRLSPVEIRIGKPLQPPEKGAKGVEAFTQELFEAVRTLLDEEG